MALVKSEGKLAPGHRVVLQPVSKKSYDSLSIAPPKATMPMHVLDDARVADATAFSGDRAR